MGGTWPISEKYEMRIWLAEVCTGTPRPTDSHDAVEWIPAANAAGFDWLDADLPILNEMALAVLSR